MTRPQPSAALPAAWRNGKPDELLKALCQGCNRRAGRVIRTDHGNMWLGDLRNPLARQIHGDKSFMPGWLDAGPFMSGECDCPIETGIVDPPGLHLSKLLHRIPSAAISREIGRGRRVLLL